MCLFFFFFGVHLWGWWWGNSTLAVKMPCWDLYQWKPWQCSGYMSLQNDNGSRFPNALIQSERADFQQCMQNQIFLSQRWDSGLVGTKFLLYGKERKITEGVERGARAPSKLWLCFPSASSRGAAQTEGIIIIIKNTNKVIPLVFIGSVYFQCWRSVPAGTASREYCDLFITQLQRCGQVGRQNATSLRRRKYMSWVYGKTRGNFSTLNF